MTLAIPSRWLWDGATAHVRDGKVIPVEYRGWRVALVMFRLTLEFRRERLGSTIPRHGLTVRVMTPWGAVNWLWRNRDWNSLTLMTVLSLHWGHPPGWHIKLGGNVEWKHFWSRQFWRLGMEQLYVNETGAWRRIPQSPSCSA